MSSGRPQLPILAFNFNDQFDVQALALAANRAQRQMILMVSSNAVRFSGFSYLTALFTTAKSESSVALYLQLDHCHSIEEVKWCVRSGFDLVMADFSHLEFDENVAQTSTCVSIAHDAGVLVEGAIGVMPDDRLSPRPASMTQPEEALAFVEQTGVDLLAISIGNAHGVGISKAHLRMDVLKAVSSVVAIPLVLHGADFYPAATLETALRNGIGKLNFGPELRLAYCGALLRSAAAEPTVTDHRPLLAMSREAVMRAALDRFSLLA